MKQFKEVFGTEILIDTNIIVNCTRTDTGKDFKQILRTLTDNKNILLYSLISGFEITKKYAQDDRSEYFLKLLNYLPDIPPDLRIINMAGVMANALGVPKKESKDYKKDNDFIIGATVATQEGRLLLSSNLKDFQRPYWDVVARECVEWEDDVTKKVENVYLLKFNYKEWNSRNSIKFIPSKKPIIRN